MHDGLDAHGIAAPSVPASHDADNCASARHQHYRDVDQATIGKP